MVIAEFAHFFYYSAWCSFQGTTVRVEFGDGTTVSEATDSHIMARAFPHTLGQPLAHFLREAAKVSDAQIITELPSIRCGASVSSLHSLFPDCLSMLCLLHH